MAIDRFDTKAFAAGSCGIKFDAAVFLLKTEQRAKPAEKFRYFYNKRRECPAWYQWFAISESARVLRSPVQRRS